MPLPQPLHVFRKDLTHLWPETLLALILFIAFAWSAPSGWSRSEYVAVAGVLAGFLHLLMPISWLVVISRLIHDEPLVGDRQFWTSRPYHWAKLLAAKLLYIFAFLYVPFFLMQVYLLKHAGLYPTTVLPALLHNLLLLTVIIVIPITALAAVTSTFARLLLSVLGAIIYLLVVAAFIGYLIWQHLTPPILQPFLIAILILFPAIALIYQYRTRRTAIARIMLIATPALVGLLILLTPATALIRHAYPVASGTGTPKFAPVPDELLPPTPAAGRLEVEHNEVQLALPFLVSGVDDRSYYTVRGLSGSVDAPGVHWTSPYTAFFGQPFSARSPGTGVGLSLPLDVFKKIGNAAADVHLSLALAHLRTDTPTTWKSSLQPFSVPGHGLCSYSSDSPDAPPICRFPFAIPSSTDMAAQFTAGSCSDSASPKALRRIDLAGGPSLLDFDPVVTVPLSVQFPPGAPQQPLFLCPGTDIRFTQAKPQPNVRVELDLKKIMLDRYVSRIPDSLRDQAPQIPQPEFAPPPPVQPQRPPLP